jgi:AcrR family transcriptional regulator
MQMKTVRRNNAARTEEMRNRLITAARALFVANGFADTSTPEIVASAGVTRGALYHHFADKKELYAAVLAEEFRSVAAEIGLVDETHHEPIEQLIAGARAYLDAMAVAGRSQLVLIDGPAVLGPEIVAALEAPHSETSLAIGVQAAIEHYQLPDLPVETLTSLLSAMFEKGVIDIANGARRSDILKVIETMIRSLAKFAKTPDTPRQAKGHERRGLS